MARPQVSNGGDGLQIWRVAANILNKQSRTAGSPLADSSTLKMEAIRSSETSVNARSTQRHIPEDDILHSHRCESLKSYKVNQVYCPQINLTAVQCDML
jgi:hypothetical protein